MSAILQPCDSDSEGCNLDPFITILMNCSQSIHGSVTCMSHKTGQRKLSNTASQLSMPQNVGKKKLF